MEDNKEKADALDFNIMTEGYLAIAEEQQEFAAIAEETEREIVLEWD